MRDGNKKSSHTNYVSLGDVPRDSEFIKTTKKLKKLSAKRFKKEAYDWQINVSTCAKLGRDTIVIAGCGSGKSLVYQLLAGKGSASIVVTPLKAIAYQQVFLFNYTNVFLS